MIAGLVDSAGSGTVASTVLGGGGASSANAGRARLIETITLARRTAKRDGERLGLGMAINAALAAFRERCLRVSL
jgi:hypothetical protein